jgi:CarD family transcriptional regulator, regulator of rRNA transcription
MTKKIEFKVGDTVVYPSHGVGEITAEEIQMIGGMELKVFVISLKKDKVTLRVPVSRADAAGLRHLSTKDSLEGVVSTLQSRAKSSKGMWSRRAQEYEAKINSGVVVAIAEVVRDLHKNVDDPDRSYSERVIYEAALSRLATEYAAIKDIDLDKATDYITEVLKEKVEAA